MKPKPAANKKIILKFMDCSVSLEGTRNIETRAIKLLSHLVQDRIRLYEVLQELEHEDDDSSARPKAKKVKPDIQQDFMRGYS
ncbi:MAG: hypothetical protein OIN87_09170 [Candidatus Methanoperedens sp.]|nr:hypothetical protein [Candidatus Methanoperedens sp.]